MWDSWLTPSTAKWVRALGSAAVAMLGFMGVSSVQAAFTGGVQAGTLSWYVWWGLRITCLAIAIILLLSPMRWLYRWIPECLERGVEVRYANPAEADEVYRLCRGFYTRDDHVINRDSLEAFLKANRNTAKIFKKNGQQVGLYIVFAINAQAVAALRNGKILSAQELNSRHAVTAMNKAKGLYVTNICARGKIVRGVVLKHLKQEIVRDLQKYRGIQFVFARMANEDGGRLIRKYQFEKVHRDWPDQQIWQYEVVPKLPGNLGLS
jgi:hypothetical protein